MRYEVWGLHPANLIESFATEPEALAEVRGLLDAGWAIDDLSLGCVRSDGTATAVEGEALVRLLDRHDYRRASRSA